MLCRGIINSFILNVPLSTFLTLVSYIPLHYIRLTLYSLKNYFRKPNMEEQSSQWQALGCTQLLSFDPLWEEWIIKVEVNTYDLSAERMCFKRKHYIFDSKHMDMLILFKHIKRTILCDNDRCVCVCIHVCVYVCVSVHTWMCLNLYV